MLYARVVDDRKSTCLKKGGGVTLTQPDSCFDGAVAQLVEHLLCKKDALSAVLSVQSRRKR